jgi:hypothetical protein
VLDHTSTHVDDHVLVDTVEVLHVRHLFVGTFKGKYISSGLDKSSCGDRLTTSSTLASKTSTRSIYEGMIYYLPSRIWVGKFLFCIQRSPTIFVLPHTLEFGASSSSSSTQWMELQEQEKIHADYHMLGNIIVPLGHMPHNRLGIYLIP